MSKCAFCQKEMLSENVHSCAWNKVVEFPDLKKFSSIKYDEDPSSRCHDCNVSGGGYHHPGCDMEECPRCGGQLISCGCLDQ
jgi:hypothetical protein